MRTFPKVRFLKFFFFFFFFVVGCQQDPGSHYHSKFDGVPVSEMTEEQRLLYRLMRRYDRASRPVYEAAKPVVIRLGITLTQVLDMVCTVRTLNIRYIISAASSSCACARSHSGLCSPLMHSIVFDDSVSVQ